MTPLLEALTDREEEVAIALGDGLSVEQVAYRLKLRPRQVRRIIEEARAKIGAANIAQLVAHVIRAKAEA